MVAIGSAMLGLGLWLAARVAAAACAPALAVVPARPRCSPGPPSVLALECGWIVTEVGRQPWIVYHVMRARDAVSDAPGLRFGYFLLIVGLRRAWPCRDVHRAAAARARAAARRAARPMPIEEP